jgi:hypothetical protein
MEGAMRGLNQRGTAMLILIASLSADRAAAEERRFVGDLEIICRSPSEDGPFNPIRCSPGFGRQGVAQGECNEREVGRVCRKPASGQPISVCGPPAGFSRDAKATTECPSGYSDTGKGNSAEIAGRCGVTESIRLCTPGAANFLSSCLPEFVFGCGAFGCLCEFDLSQDNCTGGVGCPIMAGGCTNNQWNICMTQGCGCSGIVGGCSDGACADFDTLFAQSLEFDFLCGPIICDSSPIVIDIDGDGFNLTDPRAGVAFDIRNDGEPRRLSWTTRGDDDAWLALDRDGNGTIDDGAELFGNFTYQVHSDQPNGFLALAEFDKKERGGNGNGFIDENDGVYDSLRLWTDADHNGVTGPTELQTLQEAQIRALGLSYRESRRKDRHGNEFRYRARVYRTLGGDAGWLTYDVFLRGLEE